MYLIYIIRCTLCTWCSTCCMILWGLQGADGALDVVVDQVYGELEGVVDKLAKEAQRGTLPRLVHRWLSFFIFYFFICCQQTKNIARYPAKVCWWPISIKMAKIPQSSIFHKDFFWQNILLQENLPETPSNNQPQQQQQPQQQRHNNQRQQLVSLDRFKLSFWPSVMVFKVEVRQEPSFLPDLNHAICTAQQQRNATEVYTMTDLPTHQSLLKSETLGRQSFRSCSTAFNQSVPMRTTVQHQISHNLSHNHLSAASFISKQIVHSLNLIQHKPSDTDDQSQ